MRENDKSAHKPDPAGLQIFMNGIKSRARALGFAWLHDMDLRRKLMLAFLVCIVVPLFVSSLIVVMAFRQTTLEEALRESRSNINRIKESTQEIMKSVQDLANYIALDEEVSRIALKNYGNPRDAVRELRNFSAFDTYIFFKEEVSQIKLYVPNPTILNNWEFIPLDSMVLISWWYRTASKYPGLSGWLYFDDSKRARNSRLSLVRYIKLADTNQNGLLVLDINTDRLNQILAREPFDTLVLDGNNMVVASNIPARVGRPLKETFNLEKLDLESSNSLDLEVNGHASRLFMEKISTDMSFNGLRIVSILPLESIMGRANQISLVGLTLFSLSFLAAMVAIWFLSKLLSRRLSTLASQVQQVGEGNFVLSDVESGKDEIGRLSRKFNLMVGDIQDLMAEVSQSQTQRHELETRNLEIRLSMLSSQINPHFLYNALESIRMKAVIEKQLEIARAVKLLGRLLRKKLQIGADFVSLGEEIKMVEDYLAIQKFRHEDGLQFRMLIDPACLEIQVPVFILQPLVENAVHHGLEHKPGGGTLSIEASMQDGGVRITVKDDGVGMSKTKLEALRASLLDGTGTSIGLRNVHERLELVYGKGHGLELESQTGHGMCITFLVSKEANLCAR